MENSKKSIYWINVVKALCIILIYFIHGQSYYGKGLGTINSFFNPIYVNAFFLISGYLFFKKQLSQPLISQDCTTFLAGGGRKVFSNIIFRLWLPALLFSIIEFIPKKLLKSSGGYSCADFLFETIGGGTYWFISALIIVEIISLCLLLTRNKHIWPYCISLLVCSIIGAVLFKVPGLSKDLYSYRAALASCGFFALGGLYWYYETFIDRVFSGFRLVLLIITYICTILLLNKKIEVLISIHELNAMGFIVSCIGCLLFVKLAKITPKTSFLTFIGQNSIVFYLTSGAIPVCVNIVFKHFFPATSYLGLIAYEVVTIVTAVIIAMIITRFLPFMLDFRTISKKI